LRPKLDVERILRELIWDGEVELDSRAKTTYYRLTVDTCIKNTGKYAQVSNVDTAENEISAPGVVAGFGEYQNPEPDQEAVAVRCENCRYHGGRMGSVCKTGKVQQDRPDCPSFKVPRE